MDDQSRTKIANRHNIHVYLSAILPNMQQRYTVHNHVAIAARNSPWDRARGQFITYFLHCFDIGTIDSRTWIPQD